MNKQFQKAITTAARNTGLSEKEVFHETIKVGMMNIIIRMKTSSNAVFNVRHIEKSFIQFLPSVTLVNLMELEAVYVVLHEIMASSDPFDDVISEYYERLFISKKNTRGQYMTPKSIADLVTRMMHSPETDPEGMLIGEPCCGTGTMTMSYLKNQIKVCGINNLADKTLWINDIDPDLLRIAVFQIMFHCLQHDVRIGFLDVHCNNLITQYPPDDKYRVWGMLGKSEEERTYAKMYEQMATFLDIIQPAKAA